MEILSNIQKTILKTFPEIPDSSFFYLTGGTALSAFYLYHRKSNDLDFFTTEEKIILPLSYKLEESLIKKEFKISRKRSFNSFVELFVESENESTLIHCAVDTPIRLNSPVISTEYDKLVIDSFQDIAVNKLLALFGRATFRDFIDVYFIVKEKLTKQYLIENAKRKDKGFDLYWFGVAMERIREFPENSVDFLLLIKECKIQDIQKFFTEWLKEISKEISVVDSNNLSF